MPSRPRPPTIAAGNYPLSQHLYFYLAAHPANGSAKDFLKFALSASGEAVVRNAGAVSVEPEARTPRAGSEASSGLGQSRGDRRRRSSFRRENPAANHFRSNKGRVAAVVGLKSSQRSQARSKGSLETGSTTPARRAMPHKLPLLSKWGFQ